MQYKLSTDGHRRSEAYRGTVFSKDDPNVKAIKADVARHNKVIRENTDSTALHHADNRSKGCL